MKKPRDFSNVKCYNCNEYGHYASHYRKRDQRQQRRVASNLVEEDLEPTLLMASTSFNKTQRKSSKDTPTNKSIWFAKDYDHEGSKFEEIILEEDKEGHDQDYDKLNQDSLNAAAGGNLLEKSPQDALTIIENKSKQTRAVTTAMTAMLKQLQSNPPPAQVKAVEEICVTCGGNYNQVNLGYRPQGVANQMRPLGSGSLLGNTVANPKGELKAITTRSGLVTDGPTVPTPLKSINPEEDECVEETYMDPDLTEYTIKVPHPPVQNLSLRFKDTFFSIQGTLLHQISLLMPKYQKMLKALLSNKEKLQELANIHLNENCSVVILKKLPKKLGDPGKFLILCGFSELKCKALADLGASINLMPLSVWKKLGLPDLIPTRMTLELSNRAICMPDGITRDVFVPVGKFTFPADFVVVDYESDPRVPLILGRPFLRTAHALIDVHGKEMILCDGDERLTLNMKHDTTSYSNHPHRESVNLINIFNIPSEDCLEELPNIDFFNDIHPYFDDDPLSGSTTYSSNLLLEEFTDELALITYPPDYDDNITRDIEFDLREIEVLLYQGEDSDLKDSIDQTDLANRDDLFVDPIPKMFTDEQPPDYSLPPRFDVYPNDFLEIESDANNFDNDLFDSKGEKIKEAELLIDELDLPCDILLYSEYDSFNSQDFSRDDDLPSPDNEDKFFNPGILIHENLVKIITLVAQEKKLAISYAFLVFEDFDPLFYELLVFKVVPNSMRLLPFSSKNEEKVFKPGIYTFEKVYSCFLPELSHPGRVSVKFDLIERVEL
nr:hypothetical protein [Tanacetum cinerariifolium]